jgi:hypothetical protein
VNVRQTFAINGQSEDEGSNSRPRRSVTQYTIILDLVPRVGIIEREEWLVIDQETQSIARCHRKEAGPPASGMSRETIQCIRGHTHCACRRQRQIPRVVEHQAGIGTCARTFNENPCSPGARRHYRKEVATPQRKIRASRAARKWYPAAAGVSSKLTCVPDGGRPS